MADSLSPDEGAELSRLLESLVKVFEVSDLERRLRVLEGPAVTASTIAAIAAPASATDFNRGIAN